MGNATGRPGDIVTVAGQNIYDNAPASLARLALANGKGVARDSSGNLYISDPGHHRVRKVDAVTGMITTVVGSGSWGYSGDGGPATGASLNTPQGLTFDAAGNLYIVDYGNSRIRKVSPSGVISTVAGNGSTGYSGDGGEAVYASLAYPRGIAVDASGNLFIADSSNHRIRKVSAGIITTVAGNGTTATAPDGSDAASNGIPSPQAVAVDAAGALYISESGRIRKINPGTRTLSTVADGLGTVTGMALAGNTLYVAQPYSNQVSRVDLSTLLRTGVAGVGGSGYYGDGGPGITAALSYPFDLCLDSSENLYIYDSGNHRIRMLKRDTGTIDTVAGSGSVGDGGAATDAALADPTRVLIDSADNLYFSDVNNGRIRKVDATGVITTVAGNGVVNMVQDSGVAVQMALGSVTDMALDPAGNIYFTGANRVKKLDLATGMISRVAGGGYGTPNTAYNGVPALNAAIYPTSIAFDKWGNMYIGDNSSHRIWKVDPAGLLWTFAGNGSDTYSGDGGSALDAGLRRPFSIAVDDAGNVYFSDTEAARVRKIDPSGRISLVAGNGILGATGDGGPAVNASVGGRGIALDGRGNLYIAPGGRYAGGTNAIRKVDLATGIITTVAGPGPSGFSGDGGPAVNASLSRPSSVAVDSQGNIYIADRGNGRVRKIFASGDDLTPPTVSVSPQGGTYSAAQTVTLLANEPATVYYTTDGSDPAASATRQSFDTSGQVTVAAPLVLKYYALDRAGNAGATSVQSYNITYQAVLNPEYQSAATTRLVSDPAVTEVAEARLSSRTLTYTGDGAFGGSNTLTLDRVVAITTGSYAGWEYGTGSYDFSGSRGIVYSVKYRNQAWRALSGDINGVMISEDGNLRRNKLFISSVGGVSSPQVVRLLRDTLTNGAATSYPNTTLTITRRAQNTTLSGYSSKVLDGESVLVTANVGGIIDGFSLGSHRDAEGFPGNTYLYHRGLTIGGLYTGTVFAMMNRSSQTKLEHLLARFPEISAGDAHAAAVKVDGSLWSWGYNAYGQLGNNANSPLANMPRTVLSGMLGVSAGAKHTLAVDGNGRLLAWGDNGIAALGTGDWENSFAPKPVLAPTNYFTAASAGHGFSLALDLQGKVWAWGDNALGQLGNGSSFGSSPVPQELQVPLGVTKFLSISAGDRHALALDGNARVWAWGGNDAGQLGRQDVAFSPAPVQVPLPRQIHAVAAGGGHSLALDSNGNVWAWGSNNRGQLGNGGSADSALPVQVPGLSGVVAIAAGYDHSLALTAEGLVYAWGANGRGQLGYNDPMKLDTPYPNPVMDNSGLPLLGVSSIAAGNSFSLAQGTDGRVYGWGANNYRQTAVVGGTDYYYYVPGRMNLSDTVPPTLSATPAGGSFGSPVTVTITSSESFKPVIYYTLDGSDPFSSPTRKMYGASSVNVTISSTTTLRYAGMDSGANPSRQYSELYSFNGAPYIAGTPATRATAGSPYSFTPTGSVASGTLSYSIANKPAWAAFNSTTGALTGTPSPADVGTYANITVKATANGLTASLAPFAITVSPAALQGEGTFVLINEGAQTTATTAVTLNLGCSLGEKCAFMQFSNDNLVWSAPEPFSRTRSWLLSGEDGLKTVYVNFLDANGIPSNTYFNNVVLTGSTTPSGSYLFAGKWGTGAGTGFAPDGKFFLPNAVALSRTDGSLYVADGQNCRIQKFDASLAFRGKWGGCGNGDGQFIALGGVATDSFGNVYVSDMNRIQKFAPDGALITKWYGTGTSVSMIAVGPDDTVYVTGGNTVQLFDHNGRFLNQWRVNESVSGIAADLRNNIYLRGRNNVWIYDAGGALQGSWPLPAGVSPTGYYTASGVAVDPLTNRVAVADVNGNMVRLYPSLESEGATTGVQISAIGGYGSGSDQLKKPQGVAFDSQGNLYIADTGNQRIMKVAASSNLIQLAGGADSSDGGFNLPVSVAVDPASGNILVVDQQNDRVQQFLPSGGFLGKWGGTGSDNGRFILPLDAVPDGRGNMYVLDGGNRRVQKISLSDGRVLSVIGNPGAGEQLQDPRRLAQDRDGNLLVLQPQKVTKFDSSGNYLTSWGGTGDQYFNGMGIAVDSSGPSDVVCIADAGNRRVVKFDGAGTPLGVVAAGQLANISAITVDRAGFLYLYDNSIGTINKFDPLGNLVTSWGQKASVLDGSMKFVQSLAVDASGTVFVADAHNNRIQKFVPAAIPNGSAVINSGASTTLSRSVDLTLFGQTTTGYIESMRFSNDSVNWSPWEPYATTKTGWLLPDREGTSYVYTQFRNSWGTVSSTIRSAIALKYQFFTVVTAPVDSYAPVSVTPSADASLNVTFQSVISTQANSGVKVTAAVTPPPPPAELKVYNSQVYEISAAGITFAGQPEVCLAFRPSAVASPDNMKIMHHDGTVWQDITTRRIYDLASDTGKVCGNTTSFSPFALMELQAPVNGSCGVADGGTFAGTPVDYLCAAGTASAVNGTGPWNWSCSGNNGGSTASCSAQKLAYQSAPVTTATPPGGNYSGNALLVTLQTTNNATIYYTTNGDTPTTASAVYGSPVSLSGSVVLKYFAKDSSGNSEPVKSSSYSVTPSSQPGGSYSGVKGGTTFNVLRSEGGKPYLTVVSGTTSRSFTDTSLLKPNTIYRYAVTSDSDPSQTVFMTVRTPLYNGWNIISVPYSTSGVNPAKFFSSPASTLYEWVSTGTSTEEGNSVSGSYVSAQSLTPGKGFFVKALSNGTMLSYAGTAGPVAATVTLRPGWTMIANPQTVNKTDIGSNWLIDGRPLSEAISSKLIGGSIYWWNGSTYDFASILGDSPQIEPWKGYWLLNLQNTNLTLTIQ